VIGTTVGPYRLSLRLGAGGMGAVYLAEHMLLGRTAAVKLLLPELSANQDMVARFFNEARAASAIRHAGIVEIYHFGFNSDGAAFIVMEHLRGESLAARGKRGRMSSASALAIARQIAGALAAAHAQQIIHRDLKPDNVFLVPDPELPGGERVKLLDFGIAKLVGDRSGDSYQTRAGALVGTPAYMAPEQCRCVAVDWRADLYSLGCILFELCTGRPPFVGEGIGDVLSAHIHLAPPAMRSIAPDVPAAIEELVGRLLAKDPADRMQSAEEVIHAIDVASGAPGYRTGPLPPGAARPGAEGSTPPLTPFSWEGSSAVMTPAPPAPARTRRRILFALGGLLVASAAITAIILGGGVRGVPEGARAPEPPPAQAAAPPATPPEPAKTVEPEPAKTAEPQPAKTAEPEAAPTVSIDSTPTGAEVLLDGAVVGRTPYRGVLPATGADVTYVLRRAGYKPYRLAAPRGAALERTVTLERNRVARPQVRDDRDESVNPFAN